MKAWLSPIRVFLLLLLVFAFAATMAWEQANILAWLNSLWHFVLLWTPGWLLYRFLLSRQWIRVTRWEHRVITALILFLLFDPMNPWWVFALLSVVAEALQRGLRVPTGPLVNPAASAALLLSFLGYFPSWWGTNFAPRLAVIDGGMSVAMFLVIPFGGYIAFTYKKLSITLVAALTVAVAFFLAFGVNPLFLLIEGTLAFFLLIMVVEPKTSPVLWREQVAFGMVVGLLLVLNLRLAWFEPYTFALVGTNLLFQGYRYRARWWPRRPQAAAVSASTPPTSPVVPTTN